MQKIHRLRLIFKSKRSPETIFSYLADHRKFADVHPVITKIDKCNNGYLIYETLNILGIPVSFTYPAAIEQWPLKHLVIMQATVLRYTTIEMKFEIKIVDKHTIIEEDILFKSLFPINSILKKVFKKQHIQLFRNIEEAE